MKYFINNAEPQEFLTGQYVRISGILYLIVSVRPNSKGVWLTVETRPRPLAHFTMTQCIEKISLASAFAA